MSDTHTQNIPALQAITSSVKSWTMVIVTLIFVTLYAGTFTGAIKAPDAVKDLQPIIFVIIGYYFGRIPSQQNENSLKEEIARQANKADAAASAKEKIAGERGALEEKIKNTKAVLMVRGSRSRAEASVASAPPGTADTLIDNVVKILDS